MYLKFDKYQGTGNDFIIVDAMHKMVSLTKVQIERLCDRKFGIGADGLMILMPDTAADFIMQYYNADGNRGSMCGNGARCMVHFASTKKYIIQSTVFKATDGVHKATIPDLDTNIVHLQMSDVSTPLMTASDVIINTGSPHYVEFVKSVNDVDVVLQGRKIRYSNPYNSDGINVNFVEVIDDSIHVRTYERGVENETLSCGTGVTAAVLAAAFTKRISESGTQKVSTLGGMLSVQYEYDNGSFKNIWLQGAATFVYSGEINIV